MDKLIEDVKKISQKEQLNCNLEVISEELKSKQPRKSFIKTAMEGNENDKRYCRVWDSKYHFNTICTRLYLKNREMII